jgi:hypothetical protein
VSVTAEDILTEAISSWQGGRMWHKGGGRGRNGQTCLVVGLSDARKRLTRSSSEYHYQEALAAWREAFKAVFGLIDGNPVIWNDHRSRTFEDVLLVVEQARASLKRKADK